MDNKNTNIEEYLNGTHPLSGASGVAATYRNASNDTVWVRRIAASLQPPYAGATDSYPIPLSQADIPEDAFGSYIADTFAVVLRILHFTCDSTTDGAVVLDSAAFRDSATAMGLDPAVLIPLTPAGCN